MVNTCPGSLLPISVAAVGLGVAMLLSSGCSGRADDTGLVGLWQPDPKAYSSITRLTLAADPAMGETDLLVYPEGLDHKDSRIRLRLNIRPTLRASSPAAATNQVECFRERGRWEQA